MNARTAACAALLALAALTAGCSSESSGEPGKPSKATTTAAATPTVDSAADRQACVDAVQAAAEAGTDDAKPAECESLTESDYLDAYMDGLEQHNQEGRDALQDAIDEASEAAQP